ncbi:MAG: hypothetical protein AMXMBFR64_45940 [Myxococcales bacterium]
MVESSIPFAIGEQDALRPRLHAHAALGVAPLPRARVEGPGRDRRFPLPQFEASIRGLRTAFFDGGTGPTIVFIHGLAGNLTHWLHVAPRFADRFRVVGLDLPGCGETEEPRGYSLRSYAEHVRALMDLLGIERATLVGHSMGGMVSTDFALQTPERADRIVLVNPAGFHPLPRLLRLGGEVVLREGLLNRVLPSVWRGILHNVFCEPSEHTEAFMHMVRETYRDEDVWMISRVMAGLRKDLLHRNFTAMLPGMDLPVWLIWGEKDRLVPARVFHRAARRLPHVTVCEVPRCGHMPIIEKPHTVVDFLERAVAG